MLRKKEKCILKFDTLINGFYKKKKLTARSTNMCKLKCKGLDVFHGAFLINETKFDVLWNVCKMIMIFSHGQSSLKTRFPVKEEIL